MVCPAASSGGDVKLGHILPPAIVVAGILTASWTHYAPQPPRSLRFIETPGQLPGWTFRRLESEQRLTLSYKSPGGDVEFIGMCHGNPIFLFLKYPDHSGALSSTIDGARFGLLRLEEGGLLYEDLRIEEKLVEARDSISLTIGDWQRSFSATPDIGIFVTECRKIGAAGTL